MPPMPPPAEFPVLDRLLAEPYVFDFFQAVRLLRRSSREPRADVVRFSVLQSFAFPASVIHDFQPPTEPGRVPTMTVAFLGMTGPSGVLPRHYMELILRQEREAKGEERYALRAWLDLFNHRFISLFHRTWEHYRFIPAYERREHERPEPDPFTQALYGFTGLGTRGLRNRMRVLAPATAAHPEKVLRSIDDLIVLRHAGLFAQRHRTAGGLRAVVAEYFRADVAVEQFRGQWLPLEATSQSTLGELNGDLGLNTVAGDRVWDVQGKFLVRLGPLEYPAFLEMLPDRSPTLERKGFFLLAQLVRLYAGAEFDFDIQLVLKAAAVPQCELNDDPAAGPRLGWNCWILSGPADHDAEDVIFDGEAVVRL